MFKRIGLGRNKKPLVKKANANIINYKNASDEVKATGVIWKDDVHPFMPETIIEQAFNRNNSKHRKQQVLQNPDLNKLTFKKINDLFAKAPYPFSYAYPYSRETNGNEETDVRELSEPDNKESGTKPELSKKANSSPVQEAKDTKGEPVSDGQDPVQQFGQLAADSMMEQKPTTKYEIRKDMDYLYLEWDKSEFWKSLKRCLSLGDGINSALIKKHKLSNGDPKFLVYDRTSYREIQVKNRIEWVQVEVQLPAYSALVKDVTNGKIGKKLEKDVDICIIGKDSEHYISVESTDQACGYPEIWDMWDSAIMNKNNRFLQHVTLFNGGIANRIVRVPDNLDEDVYKDIDKMLQSGIVAPSLTLKFSNASNPEHIDKLYSCDTTVAQPANWTEANDLNTQDYPIRKSFMDEKAQNEGGLGGSGATMMDKEESDDDLYVEWKKYESFIKRCNKTFFGVKDDDYIIIPWQEENAMSESSEVSPNKDEEMAPEDKENPLEDDKKEPKKEEKPAKSDVKEKQNSLQLKFNSLTDDGLYLWEGDLLVPNEPLPQVDGLPLDHPDQVLQYVDPQAILDFVNDPKSVKEYYHYSGTHKDEILKEEATAKIRVKGVNPENGGLRAEILFFEKPDNDELDLSPSYYCREVLKPDGKIWQTDIDLRNNIDTKFPRSGGSTKARPK